MHEILTAAGNFFNIFPCNIQNPHAADIFWFLQNFPCGISKSYIEAKFGHRDSFYGFSTVPHENFHMQEMFF